MIATSSALPRGKVARLFATLGPVTLIFLSTNIANVGNLAYNMLFSRWMGPELFGELAVLLTIKLSVLAVLNAVQMAVSRDVAAGTACHASLGTLSRLSLYAGLWTLPLLIGIIWATGLSDTLGLSSPTLLYLLAAALPFATPLCLARGIVTGQLNTSAIITSTQVEMAVRLGLGTLAWHMGAGIEGVTITIVLSIFAGWIVIAKSQPSGNGVRLGMRRAAGGLALAALPFGLLQLAQVALLDGDVILARLWLGSEPSGHAAALALFQRIAFFACFGMASVLLPAVALAHQNKTNTLAAARPVVILFAAVAVPLLLGATVIPGTMVTLMVGPAFAAITPMLAKGIAAALAFTLSYLLATWLIATGNRTGLWLIAGTVPVQFALAAVLTTDLSTLLSVKLACQLGLLGALILTAAAHHRRSTLA